MPADLSVTVAGLRLKNPVIAGSGCNFQRHCHRAIFTGIGWKFADFIQAIHRIQRFQQTEPVRIDLIYTEAERDVRTALERKWRQHEVMVEKMTTLRSFGFPGRSKFRWLLKEWRLAVNTTPWSVWER